MTQIPDNEIDNPKRRAYSWIKYVVYLWSFRMIAISCGGILPIFFQFFAGIQYDHSDDPQKSEGFELTHWKSIQSIYWSPILFSEDGSIDRLMLLESVPLLVKHLPVQPSSVAASIAEAIVNSSPRKLFTKYILQDDSEKEFVHYSDSRSWARHTTSNFSRGYHLQAFTPGDLQSLRDQVNLKYQYWHMSVPIPTATQLAWMTSLCPPFANLFSSSIKQKQPQTMLWLGNTNATVGYHYDMEDSLFLQVDGKKTFALLSPNAIYSIPPLYPSSHPRWRQLQQPTTESESQFLTKSAVVVELEPGDLLYLPAFYFHKVITGSDHSLSINGWIPSEASKVYDRLIKYIDMPFNKKSPLQFKLASLGSLIRTILHVSFKEELPRINQLVMKRYTTLVDSTCSSATSCSSNALNGNEDAVIYCRLVSNVKPCGHEDIKTADANLKVKKTSHSIEALFKKSMPDQAIQLMLLMDYMEEVLEVIQDPISLCDVVTFVSSCVVKDST